MNFDAAQKQCDVVNGTLPTPSARASNKSFKYTVVRLKTGLAFKAFSVENLFFRLSPVLREKSSNFRTNVILEIS